MSMLQPTSGDRRPPPPPPGGDLGTNNPFRARLSVVPPLSPASDTNRFSFQSTAPRERPKSTNPFLDLQDDDIFDLPPERPNPVNRANSFDTTAHSNGLTGSAAELFENLTITTDNTQRRPSFNMPSSATDSPRSRGPPPRPPPKRHGSQDTAQPLINISPWDDAKAPPRRPQPGGERPRDRDGDRPRPRPRPRRNSDSSVVEVHEIENRRRERSARDPKTRGDGKSRPSDSKNRKKHPALDVIDKLDVTGIYGSGLFHHDGPFDACNPHRNKSSRRLAPVQAFPEDSANNSMTGFGPIAKPDHSHVFGTGAPEAFHDYTTAARPSANRAVSFDPKAAIETVHGSESMGLGTSTFLDGAPASKKAIAEAAAANPVPNEDRPRSSSQGEFGSGGLQRKKSLAQKFRSISVANKAGPDGPLGPRRRPPPPPGAGRRSPPGSDGKPSPNAPVDRNGTNSFFQDNDGSPKDGKEARGHERAPSSPKKTYPELGRVNSDGTTTGGGVGGGGGGGGAGGLLKRVRSMSRSKRN